MSNDRLEVSRQTKHDGLVSGVADECFGSVKVNGVCDRCELGACVHRGLKWKKWTMKKKEV